MSDLLSLPFRVCTTSRTATSNTNDNADAQVTTILSDGDNVVVQLIDDDGVPSYRCSL